MAGIEVQPQSLAHGMSANRSMQIGSEINKWVAIMCYVFHIMQCNAMIPTTS
jgi:hypothetical protein